MTPRRHIAASAVIWLLLGAAYFLIPLLATLLISLRNDQTAKCCTLANYGYILHDPDFWTTIKLSFIVALETIVLTLALLVPTVYWVHLKVPRLRPVIGFLALVPFVVAPIILVVGLLDVYRGTPQWFYGEPYGFLAAAYVILAFPYMYFSLDTGFRSIDVHTLTEASQSLGAGWPTTLSRDPAEHQGGGAGGLLPDARDRDGRVHDREPRPVQHVLRLRPVHQPEQDVSGGSGDAARIRDHVGRDAGPARRRERAADAAAGRGGALGMAGVELKQLHRRFGEVVALAGIDLDIRSGEFVSFLGPSGCGKTTALRLVAGFDRPTSGQVLIAGKDITGVPPNKRDIGMVFQAYSLFPNMTAARNVEFGLRVRKQGHAARRGRAVELLSSSGSRTPRTGTRTSCPAACSSASRSRARSRSSGCSSSTSRSRPSMRRCACSCARRSAASRHASGSPPSTSPTTRRRRCRSPTASRCCRKGASSRSARRPRSDGAPATPFVAEFVGTMNRLEATVADPGSGAVEYDGVQLPVDAARGRARGERVLLLVRPETVAVEAAGTGEAGIAGEVDTFLGSVTRLRVLAGPTEWTADLSTERAAALPIGSQVRLGFPAGSAKLLSLEASPASPAAAPDDR